MRCRKYLERIVFVAAGLSGGASLLWSMAGYDYQPKYPRMADLSRSSAIDIEAEIYTKGELTSEIKAEMVAVVPRKFMYFNVKGMNEIVITNAKINTHLKSIGEIKSGVMPTTNDFVFHGTVPERSSELIRYFGVITRISIQNIHWEIYRGGKASVYVKANYAYIMSTSKGKFYLVDAVLQSYGRDKKIISKKIIWNANERYFLIPGEYYAETPKGSATGIWPIRVDLDFQVSAA